MWDNAPQERFHFCFQGVFASINKFFFGGRMPTRV